MNEDDLFRRLMIAGVVVTLAIAIPFRVKSHATREPLDRRQEGVFILATLRPIAAMFWIGVFAYLINPKWLAWAAMALPASLRWTGVALCAAAAVALYWTMSTLGPNLTDTVVTRKVHTLVTRGPYRWVRHPFYGCVTLMLTAVTLLSANWFLMLTGGLVISLLVMRTRKEEELLVARFGDAYRAYMTSTGRFLPKLSA
jgi:protein-S-isoprenylcysteine O-methyltransferase Ste14